MDSRTSAADDFLQRLSHVIKTMKISERQAALLAVGKSGHIATMRRQGSIPRGDVVAAYARALNTSTDFLLGTGFTTKVMDAEAGQVFNRPSLALEAAWRSGFDSPGSETSVPTLDAVLTWWRQSGKRLTSVNDLLEFCDVYRAPKVPEDTTTVVQVGRNSVAAKTLGAQDPSVLNEFINRMPKTIVENVSRWHWEACQTGKHRLTSEIITTNTGLCEPFVLEYDRLSLPVYGPDGENLIVNFARLVGPPQHFPRDKM